MEWTSSSTGTTARRRRSKPFSPVSRKRADATWTSSRFGTNRPATPTLRIDSDYDASEKRLTLTIRQQTPPTPKQADKPALHVPLRIGLVDATGADLPYTSVTGAETTGDVVHITAPVQKVVFHDVAEQPVASLLRGFSAPVTLKSDLDDTDLLFLAANDADAFNRWEALQTVIFKALIEQTSAGPRQQRLAIDPRLIAAIEATMADDALEPAFRALCLQLPGEADIAREIGSNVDPEAIHLARAQMRAGLASALGPVVKRVYGDMKDTAPYSPDAASAGRRALKNVLLDYLGHAQGGGNDATVRHHFDVADNMTDRLAALTVLVHARLPGYKEALDAFAQRHAGTPLAMDKWFMVQATAPGDETLASVQALTRHPGFSPANPNRVRALIGAFASGNQSQFNRADGAGFDFIADFALELDTRNPQAAARLLSAFRSWRALEPVRRARAKTTLEGMAQAADLSPDVRDIVDRCLQ